MSTYPNLSEENISVLTEFFNFIDSNKDGFISIQEIQDACMVDVDGDDTITQAEIEACAQPWVNRLNVQDLNADTKISLDELLEYNNNYKDSST
jgi:Ca2+-binding EF-hand superfamily protein